MQVEEFPKRICTAYQRFLFGSAPLLDLFLPLNGMDYLRMPFKVDQIITEIPASECGRVAAVHEVLLKPTCQIVCDTYI